MSLELAKAYIRVRADGSQLRPDLEGARKDFLPAARAMGQDAGKSIADGIRAGLVGVLTPAALFTKGFLRSGLAQAAEFEQTNIAFNTMLGSAKETTKLLADLTQFAALTPFEMPELLQAARGLVQFGERGEELMETLEMLGNAASGTSTPFGMIALIFNQVRGVGKLLTQDFRQLSTRGVISLQDIAKHYKVTTEEAQTMLSTGKISFEDLKAILKGLSEEGGRFFQLMEKQSQSLSGLQSTLSDAWGIMARQLATALVPAVKTLTDAAVKAVEALSAVAAVSGEAAGAAIVGASAFASLGAALASASLAARIFGVSLTGVLIGSGIGVAIIAIGAALGVITQKIAGAVRSLLDISVITDRISVGLKNLQIAFGIVWDAIKIGVADVMDSFSPLVTLFQTTFINVAIWAADAFQRMSVAAVELATKIAFVFRNIKGFVQIALLEMQIEFLELKILAINVWHEIQTSAAIAVNQIMIRWQELVISAKTAAHEIRAGWIAIFSAIQAFTMQIITNMITAFGTLVERIPMIMQTVMTAIRENPLMIGAAADIGKAMIEELANAVSQDMPDPAEAGAKAFKDSIKDSGGPDLSEEEKKILILKRAQDALNKSIADTKGEEKEIAELRKRQQDIADAIAAAEAARKGAKPEDPSDPDKPPPKDEKGGGGGVDAGRFRVEEFGNVFQDAVLKGEDQQVKMVGLLEAGNKLQEQQLAATKDSKPTVLAGDGDA